ncbi:SRPBCC family protein [Micromonospora sp. WMMD987]|jgi:hypothetical protein|uniref:SRPBCC family protein n=1 Tax=Micromonospora TaxID=1873 RepID=UPI002499DA81|nr:SRPBCC family protein [Micromonospora sp. WMMD987]WFE97081.1 SRPBCC family protein [Micromonospora sp. WMMD987]
MRFETTTEIDADIDTVWAVQTDVERWPEWNASVRTAGRGEAGPLALGATARLEQPRLRPTYWQVTEFDPPRCFVWESTAPGVRSRGEHRIVPLPDGRVRVELVLVLTGPLAMLTGWLGGRLVRRYLRLEADGLRQRCEAG